MKSLLTLFLIALNSLWLCGQGSGFGYYLDMGGSAYSQPAYEYDQIISSYTQNGFVRFHKNGGRRALQLMVGYKTDEAWFQNSADYLAPDGVTLMQYNTDAYLERTAWKFGVIQQYQFGKRPGRFMFSINPGLFYEHTIQASRYDSYDMLTYELHDELNPRNIGYTLGFEVRFRWFTMGYKAERLFGDVLNRDYILSQELSADNSSELRGLVLNPKMNYFYIGINIDFFDE